MVTTSGLSCVKLFRRRFVAAMDDCGDDPPLGESGHEGGVCTRGGETMLCDQM